jgi:hypothetical protein
LKPPRRVIAFTVAAVVAAEQTSTGLGSPEKQLYSLFSSA